MKKQFLTMVFVAVSTSMLGQIKMDSDGRVGLGTTVLIGGVKVTSGDSYSYNYPSTYSIGLQGRSSTGYHSIGVKGTTYAPNNASSIAVQGIAGGGASGYIYGVFGALNETTKNGAGVVGTLLNHTGINVPGRYAGYFDGPVMATEAVSAPDFVTSSDIRLKENIISLSEDETEKDIMQKLLNLNVIKYNYIDKALNADSDTALIKREDAKKETHYGLVAQELKAIFPSLVKEGQDGYLGVNYVELVPILIRSVQELEQELEEVRSGIGYMKTRSEIVGVGNVAQTPNLKNKLFQNKPNPFKEQTIIRFSLADDVKNAAICIFDMTGKTIKKLPISSGMDSVSIGGYELGEGMFLYSLIVNGEEIDTKKMVISK
jgi:hypothetical protein